MELKGYQKKKNFLKPSIDKKSQHIHNINQENSLVV